MSLVHVPKSGLLRQDCVLARLGCGVASVASGSFIRHSGPRRRSRDPLADDRALHATKRPLVKLLIDNGYRCKADIWLALLSDRRPTICRPSSGPEPLQRTAYPDQDAQRRRRFRIGASGGIAWILLKQKRVIGVVCAVEQYATARASRKLLGR